MFCLKTSSGLQNCPFGRQYVFFFVRCRFTCLAYLGGLSFDFCECFTLFNDEALNFLTFYTQTAKAVCDACTLLPCSPIYLQGGLGGTNEPQVCDATPKRFFIRVLWKTNYPSATLTKPKNQKELPPKTGQIWHFWPEPSLAINSGAFFRAE